MTEEEVLGELAPLTVLLAYVMISTGRSDDAVERLQPIIAGELPQREVAAIAANNWAVACFNTGKLGWFSRAIMCDALAVSLRCWSMFHCCSGVLVRLCAFMLHLQHSAAGMRVV
jgi:hypothetical protein